MIPEKMKNMVTARLLSQYKKTRRILRKERELIQTLLNRESNAINQNTHDCGSFLASNKNYHKDIWDILNDYEKTLLLLQNIAKELQNRKNDLRSNLTKGCSSWEKQLLEQYIDILDYTLDISTLGFSVPTVDKLKERCLITNLWGLLLRYNQEWKDWFTKYKGIKETSKTRQEIKNFFEKHDLL